MILKHINQTVCAGAFVLLGAVSVTSCTDKNDWGVDASHDRCLLYTSDAADEL